MGYCGSKSVVNTLGITIVKEQRVDGSWHNVCLRCILTDLEINYQVKILYNQINKKYIFILYVNFLNVKLML